ncbi:hypothetical protein ZWY2020_047923 [Hordeum vulgare]|nr:hypothetical protein ZWY2020_047923 [Hordeum vulgare]
MRFGSILNPMRRNFPIARRRSMAGSAPRTRKLRSLWCSVPKSSRIGIRTPLPPRLWSMPASCRRSPARLPGSRLPGRSLPANLKEKKTVLHIHNKPNVGYRRGITEFAEGKLRKSCCSDLLDIKIAKEIDHLVQAIVDESGKLYKRVFTDYKLVQDRLYIHLPKGGDVKTITSNP